MAQMGQKIYGHVAYIKENIRGHAAYMEEKICGHVAYTRHRKYVGMKLTWEKIYIPYILKSNPHPFYSFSGLKNQMRITIVCGLDSRSRAGFWKNYGAAVCAIRTIQ